MRNAILMMLAFLLSVLATSVASDGYQGPTVDGDYVWSSVGNPIIRHLRTADPSAHVWQDGRLWIYASHDMDDATNYSSMDGYHVFSTDDLKTWTDHGEVLHSRDVSWGTDEGGWMWAPDCAYMNGTYYLYFPHKDKSGSWRTGVAVSDYPQGPFKDIGHYIEGTSGTDPACFIDDDGQAYLYFGAHKVARLKENMVELAESPRNVDYGADNFGEGAWMHKRNGVYYYSYTEFSNPDHQAYYSTGDNPYGPFEYKGAMNGHPIGAQDHHSIVEYRGIWYYFYHVGNYNGGTGNRRNVCVEYLYYNGDGTMQMVQMTGEGLAPDPIGMTNAIAIPGEVLPDQYFSQQGTSPQGGRVLGVSHEDYLEYVFLIAYPEEYNLEVDTTSIQYDGQFEILVDGELVQTVSFVQGQTNITASVQLHNGRHTFRLHCSSSQSQDLMDIKAMRLFSDDVYFEITAHKDDGGVVFPPGEIYYKAGDSASYTITPDLGHIIDDVLVDGVSSGKVETLTFNRISENHRIDPVFVQGTNHVEMWVQFDDQPAELLQEARNIYGTLVRLLPEPNEAGSFMWTGPSGYQSTNQNVVITIAPETVGRYTLEFTDAAGCRTLHPIQVEADRRIIEAEDYSAQSGIQTEGTGDLWGGQNVGFINDGDWAEYDVNIINAGTYALSYRVAGPNTTSRIELHQGGQLLQTTALPATGGWQSWVTTAAQEVNLSKGRQTLRLYFAGDTGFLFNLNWFKLELIEGTEPRVGDLVKAGELVVALGDLDLDYLLSMAFQPR